MSSHMDPKQLRYRQKNQVRSQDVHFATHKSQTSEYDLAARAANIEDSRNLALTTSAVPLVENFAIYHACVYYTTEDHMAAIMGFPSDST